MGDFTVKVTGFGSNAQVDDQADGLAKWWSESHAGYVGDWGKRPTVFNVDPTLADLTIHDLLDKAGCGFNATKTPAFVYNPHSGIYVQSSDTFFVVRDDTWEQIGSVGSDYTVAQYADVLDAIVGDLRELGGVPTRVIGLNGGSRVLIQVGLPDSFWVNNSQHGLFLNVWASHDGTTTVGGNSTDFRVVCANTYAMAKGSLLARFFTRHTKNVTKRLADLAKVVGIIRKDYVEYGQDLFKLAETNVNSTAVNEFLLALLPDAEKDGEAKRDNAARANRRNEIATQIYVGAGNSDKLTAYDLFQGVTGYVDRKQGNRDDGAQWAYATSGPGANLKAAAWDILTAK